MKKITIGDIIIIYLGVQVAFGLSYHFDLFQSKLLAVAPSILFFLAAIILIFVLLFLNKYYNNDKDTWDNK